jgi:hypothetical protein
LHYGVASLRAALAVFAALAAAVAVLSGDSGADPRTPAALPGMPAPFLGTAVLGDGGLTAAIDAYGDVVDLRAPGPAGAGLIDNPSERQLAGSVSPRTGIVPRVRVGGRAALPLWRADRVSQTHLSGTNVVRTTGFFQLEGGRGRAFEIEIVDAARGGRLARSIWLEGPPRLRLAPVLSIALVGAGSRLCEQERRGRRLSLLCSTRGGSRGAIAAGRGAVGQLVDRTIAAAGAADRRWLSRARRLGAGSPRWARRMYRRSLLTLHALTDRRTGAVAAGARDGWAYVWPRDAATAALALAAAGYRSEARRVARFLLGLDLGAAARFEGAGAPAPGRGAQGDAAGWVAAAARASGPAVSHDLPAGPGWRDRADYQEGSAGDYLANAIASTAAARRASPPIPIAALFSAAGGLVRRAGDPRSGLDPAAAWAVRPFPDPALFPAVRSTLLALARHQSRFGIAPGEEWSGADPWTAPTAWTAWALAALGERRAALRLLGDLRRAATPAGELPERLDVRTGIPRSTTPLAWSHAFAILALRELWPDH